MKVIYNRFIPFRGFVAINLFGVIFARREYRPVSDKTLRHEQIHTAQMRETAYLFFYLLYLFEYLYLLVRMRNFRDAYRAIRFEREAYRYESTPDYMKKRKPFQWCYL
ncbi:hypothetical protein TFKS16_2029 [Tannerella forsythia KS16]|uniref:DUF4157 domain-containing protein n=1 Tax=Tannerella forsythia TaxID=28112 RepID=A0A2A6EAD6_TANFO|nr:hypothetical protein [Tannerella forsythia]PDP44714.1 hypothetical protein CLI86_02225 [Tannerella forsythia]BAR50229.1 hypothetical protein TF3313_2817 [Tannerella forsythia 3313]BAR52242.1 hypothetical protein TFKS16_2029 [Tannerella forsythia KS16]